jgi:hypothetical protein
VQELVNHHLHLLLHLQKPLKDLVELVLRHCAAVQVGHNVCVPEDEATVLIGISVIEVDEGHMLEVVTVFHFTGLGLDFLHELVDVFVI